MNASWTTSKSLPTHPPAFEPSSKLKRHAKDSPVRSPKKPRLLTSYAVLHSPTTEEIWSDDVQAIFVDALRAYPPSRHSYRPLDGPEDATSHSESGPYARCELIQGYIYRNSGTLHTRSQISSHIERMSLVNKDDPLVLALPHEDYALADAEDASVHIDMADVQAYEQASARLPETLSSCSNSRGSSASPLSFIEDTCIESTDEHPETNTIPDLPTKLPSTTLSPPKRQHMKPTSAAPLLRRRSPQKAFPHLRLDISSAPRVRLPPLQPSVSGTTSLSEQPTPSSKSVSSDYSSSASTPTTVPNTPLGQIMHTPLEPPQLRRDVNPRNVDKSAWLPTPAEDVCPPSLSRIGRAPRSQLETVDEQASIVLTTTISQTDRPPTLSNPKRPMPFRTATGSLHPDARSSASNLARAASATFTSSTISNDMPNTLTSSLTADTSSSSHSTAVLPGLMRSVSFNTGAAEAALRATDQQANRRSTNLTSSHFPSPSAGVSAATQRFARLSGTLTLSSLASPFAPLAPGARDPPSSSQSTMAGTRLSMTTKVPSADYFGTSAVDRGCQ